MDAHSSAAASLTSGVRQVGDVGAMVDLPAGEFAVALYRDLRRRWPRAEPVPGWASVLVSEPGVSARTMVERLRTVLSTWDPEGDPAQQSAWGYGDEEALSIAVVYDGDDLDEVAATTGMSRAEVIAAHTQPTYTVALLGFSRGFPYFRGLDPRLRMPRLASPRVRVPAGSVGIALDQTGIYPMSSPGGWRLLGHTEAVLFDPRNDPPSALEPGTRVRFVDRTPSLRQPGEQPQNAIPATPMTRGTRLVVDRSGPATTVQDGGRTGRAAQGVPRSGAADLRAWALGNRLVGNHPDAAGLEVTLGGLEFTPTADVIVALTGATCSVALSAQPRRSSQRDHSGLNVAFVVPAGETLRLGVATHGLRCYVAIRGGVDVPAVLGSRATDTLGGIGPAQVRDGDEVPIGTATHGPAQWSQLPVRPPTAEQVLRFEPGWRSDWFEPDALATLTSTRWVVSSTSSRIGLRLDGPALARRLGELPSEPMVAGAIQVPSNGQPIVLGPDSGTTGGYPVIGVVSREDLCLAGQAPPGSVLRFRPT